MEARHSWLLLTGSLLLCELNKISILRTRAGRVLPSRQKLPKTAIPGSFASIFSCLAHSGLQKVARIAKLPLLHNICIASHKQLSALCKGLSQVFWAF